ncbi:sulfotransferase family protein [Halieaceae bacterium IMCC14734]|uniref:Sulfotransferase family protein n=1 Tax=Candidatus Litorirhabdus singularis TaxID=2518993 RepID=A0ABT3TG08_9GAMM|nr:sulfotransferase [Candidatus Litorirhabdus singularis]MCX2980974.1 sulfotransferase family protein [Candidatus Litorirhabdus singularis]
MKSEQLKLTLPVGNPPSQQTMSYQQLFDLARSEANAARYAAAAYYIEALATAAPQDFDAQLFAADIMLLNRELSKAAEYARKATDLKYDAERALVMQSRIAMAGNDGATTIAFLQALLELNPGNHRYHCEMGDAYLALGDSTQALACYNQALNCNKREARSALQMARLPGPGLSKPRVRQLEFLLDSAQLNQADQIYAHFALANTYDKKGDIEKQFKHLTRGNQLADLHHVYSSDEHWSTINATRKFFTQDRIRQLNYPNAEQRRIIFVIGMPRSGSTLIEQILCAHPQVASAGENPHMHHAVSNFCWEHGDQLPFPAALESADFSKMPEIAANYLGAISDLDSSPVIIDKTLGNYLYPGLIAAIFPHAKFIHSARHPVATCYGCYKVLFGSGLVPFSYRLDHLAAHYRGTQEIIEFWNVELPGKVYTQHYETLVADQKAQTRALLEFCELPWNDDCLEFHKGDRAVSSASNFQVKQKLYSSAVSEWEKFTDYLGPILAMAEELENEENGG